MELLGCSDLQRVVVLSLYENVLVWNNRLSVPVPADGVFWRTLHSAGEEQGAADACFQVLGRQRHSQWI